MSRSHLRQLRVFQVHAAVFAAVMVVIVLVNLFTNTAAGITGQWSAWWSARALIGWGLGIVVRGLVVRLSRPESSSRTWEEQQIDEIPMSVDSGQSR